MIRHSERVTTRFLILLVVVTIGLIGLLVLTTGNTVLCVLQISPSASKSLAAVRTSIQNNRVAIGAELIDPVLNSISFPRREAILRDSLRDTVTQQLTDGFDTTLDLDCRNLESVKVRLTDTVTFRRVPQSPALIMHNSAGANEWLHPMKGTIEIEQNYIVTLLKDETLKWKRLENELQVIADITPN